jgi:uncharacterized zinc-type alcohol dehydrogenase-like protein
MIEAKAYGAPHAKELLQPLIIPRRNLTELDVLVKIMYCGVCHSDKHHIYNDWGDSKFPIVPGHEIIGIVQDIGCNVSKFNIGDEVAIGNMTDSCQHCEKCEKGDEQYCLSGGPTWTYNSKERVNEKGRTLKPVGQKTYGGYSTLIVSQEKFVFKLPYNLDLARSAPLLCAGITMYYPLKHWKIGKGHKVAIAGIGGLGHLGIKFTLALGAEVVALTTSEWKVNDSLKLGADDAILMDKNFINYINIKHKINSDIPVNGNELKVFKSLSLDKNIVIKSDYLGKFDLIIDTIPVAHDVTPYLHLLKPGGSKLHIVGNMNEFPNLKGVNLVFPGKNITSSNVGGTYDTKEMLEFCSDNDIQADIELIDIKNTNQMIQMMVNKKAHYRYVIDMSSF